MFFFFLGSEDNYIYMWRTSDLPPSISVRKDRNPMWERVRAHNSVVTAAVFAPKPNFFLSALQENLQNTFINNNNNNNNGRPDKAKISTASISSSCLSINSKIKSNSKKKKR